MSIADDVMSQGGRLPPLTPSQTQRANEFLAMVSLTAGLGADHGVSRDQTEPDRPHSLNQEGPAPSEPPAWMVTLDELETALNRRPSPRVHRQLQPVAPLAELLDLKQFRPKRGRGAGTAGAAALAARLDTLARTRLATCPHLYSRTGHPPRQIILHLSAELLAAALGVSDNTLRRWTAQLQEAGFVRAALHYTSMTNREGRRLTVVDGTLYAVRLVPGHTARLRYADYKRAYRDLDADRQAGRTAYNAIRNARQRWQSEAAADVLDTDSHSAGSQVPMRETVQEELHRQLQRWAVTPGSVTTDHPLHTDHAQIAPDELNPAIHSVQDVVYVLPVLTQVPASRRAALVNILGSVLARSLDDQHSHAWYCGLIWQAWRAENGRHGGLQVLAAQLQRLEVDRREWPELRRPAALLAARLRAA
ncbi:hypothetical protein GCM10010914_30030 [Deinococcus wulumuqiensis]|uniref:Helix-turn-helix domain-containing protein n=1 Tax=Deinococcus wulumuqiensis TaxID=980427 RepID=A0AAV4K8H7_9DEIO|nr:hypothetical protein GCM10010914_30030 [Deinococcus wulumuqiensis]GGP31253.1 hypothetical protein GCM10008021_29040 [Deinococcus wulumuqiensis]